MIERVIATPAALRLIDQLVAEHGPVLFHQSGGCCDGSGANCFPRHEFAPGPSDLLLGEIGGSPFYIVRVQYEYLKHAQLIIDAIKGHSGTFSLEGSDGTCFYTRSRLFTEAELAELAEPR